MCKARRLVFDISIIDSRSNNHDTSIIISARGSDSPMVIAGLVHHRRQLSSASGNSPSVVAYGCNFALSISASLPKEITTIASAEEASIIIIVAQNPPPVVVSFLSNHYYEAVELSCCKGPFARKPRSAPPKHHHHYTLPHSHRIRRPSSSKTVAQKTATLTTTQSSLLFSHELDHLSSCRTAHPANCSQLGTLLLLLLCTSDHKRGYPLQEDRRPTLFIISTTCPIALSYPRPPYFLCICTAQ